MGAALGLSGGGGLSSKMTGPLRILALMTDAFGGSGGIAQYNRHLLSSLAGCDLVDEVVVLPRGAETSPDELPHGLRQLGPVRGRLAYSLAALREARARRPFHVVFCGHLFMAPLATVIAKLLRARLWVQVHGIEAWQESPSLYRRSLEMATLVTSVSRYTRRRLLAWSSVDPVHVKVLPNTFDPVFTPGSKPAYLRDRYAAHGKKVLMTISRLAASERYKGHDRVIRVLPRILSNHPETIYLVVGDGDDRPRLETLATNYGVRERVQFAGSVLAEELPDHLRLADLVVMPSTGEGFGIVFLEAMAAGVEVIGGNQDGSLDPLADGVLGRSVDPESESELTAAICATLRGPAPRTDRAARFALPAFDAHLEALIASSFANAA